MLYGIVLCDVAPTAVTALRAEQLFKPFITDHLHGVGPDRKLRLAGVHAPLTQLLGCQQVQKILFAIAFNALVVMGWAQ